MIKNFKILKTIFAFAFMVLSFTASAQQEVTGKVVDENGDPIEGVMVYGKSRNMYAVTEINGEFTLTLQSDETTLNALLMGYEAVEVPVSQASNIVMKSLTKNLGGVVVVGYGTSKLSDFTGSVVSVKEKDFSQGQITSPDQLITGKVAGAQINLGSGAPGDGGRIRIRGVGSINANSDPLIVIDGIPVEGTGVSGSQNILNTINPNDIASIDVLKDASATAIYGARAANGVIIITTKQGNKTQKLKIGLSTKVSAYTPFNKVDVLSADQFRGLVNELGDSTAMARMGSASTDWQDEIYTTALGLDNNISFTGGIKNLPYRFSFGALNQEGILRTGKLDRYSTNLTMSPTLFKEKLKLDLNARAVRTNSRFANTGAIGAAVAFDPTQSNSSANYNGYWEWLNADGTPNINATRNPLGLLYNREDMGHTNRFLGNVKLDYQIVKNLNAVLNLGTDRSKGWGNVYVPATAAHEWVRGGTNNQYEQTKTNNLLDAYLKYEKTFKEDHNLELTGGYSYQDFITRTPAFDDLTATDSVYEAKGLDGFDQYTFLGFFGRANYNFKGKYYLTATLRNDYSSKFAKDVRSGLFPSFAFAWRMSEEDFLKDAENLSNLKFRVGWGQTGQSNVGNSYNYLPLYVRSDNAAQYQFGNNYYYTYRPSVNDPSFTWETTVASNLGFDFGFYNNRVNGSIDFYNRESKDLINTVPLPAGSIGNEITTNVGNMTNKGVEIILNFVPVSTEKFNWTLGTNFSRNKNTITKLTNANSDDYKGVFVGGISGGVGSTIQIMAVNHSVNSFYVMQQAYDANGNPLEGVYVDRNGDGQVNLDDRYIYTTAEPRLSYGITNTFNIRKFSLSFLLRGQTGNYMYNNVASDRGAARSLIDPNDYLANLEKSYLDTRFGVNQYFSDYYVQNAAFLKMDYLNLGYNFGQIGKRGIEMGIGFSIQNVMTITKYSGLDPEIAGGIDNNFYPRARTYSLGANFQF